MRRKRLKNLVKYKMSYVNIRYKDVSDFLIFWSGFICKIGELPNYLTQPIQTILDAFVQIGFSDKHPFPTFILKIITPKHQKVKNILFRRDLLKMKLNVNKYEESKESCRFRTE